MRKERIGYDALLEELLVRGALSEEIAASAARALQSGSQVEQWEVLLRALGQNESLRRISSEDAGGPVRFLDIGRAHIITLTPPPIPIRNYEVHVSPRIPDGIRTRERLTLIDPILTSVATCQSEAELGSALEKIGAFIREVLSCPLAFVTPLPVANAARPDATATPVSRVILDGSDFLEFIQRRVIGQGRFLYIPDLAEEPELGPQLAAPALRCAALFPLRTGGETFGLLEAWNVTPRSVSEDDLGLLALLANIAAGVVKNARRLEQLIFIDPLTGVYTRGYFDEEFRREIERSNRSGNSLALLMVDIDFFKQVNDDHGHAAGDRALSTVAQLLKSNVRQLDVVTRYGGEEFALLLPGATEEEARLAAERLRKVVEATPIFIDDRVTLNLTVSVGGALYPNHARSREELLDMADRIALLSAKRGGRNRVILVNGAPPAAGAEPLDKTGGGS